MVMAVEEKDLPELQKLADTFQTELTVLGHSDNTGILKVWHQGGTGVLPGQFQAA